MRLQKQRAAIDEAIAELDTMMGVVRTQLTEQAGDKNRTAG